MAELLIQTVDKTNSDDVFKDVRLFKRGDVIAVVPDNWVWGHYELNNPEWTILKMPNESVEMASTLLSEELHTEEYLVGTNPMLQIRGFYINLDVPVTTLVEMTCKRLPRKNPNIIE